MSKELSIEEIEEKALVKRKTRDYWLVCRYGITIDDWELMYAAQGGACKICKNKKKKRLVVDHNHTTGKVRGLLCTRCNNLLGMAKDSIDTLSSAVKYLTNNP